MYIYIYGIVWVYVYRFIMIYTHNLLEIYSTWKYQNITTKIRIWYWKIYILSYLPSPGWLCIWYYIIYDHMYIYTHYPQWFGCELADPSTLAPSFGASNVVKFARWVRDRWHVVSKCGFCTHVCTVSLYLWSLETMWYSIIDLKLWPHLAMLFIGDQYWNRAGLVGEC